MHYVISDIHGCYNEYIKALKAVNFNDNDILYVLGDCIDRGYASVRVLQDMMSRPNVIPILGNYEYMAVKILEDLCIEITEENAESRIPAETVQAYTDWMFHGGLEPFSEGMTVEDFSVPQILFSSADLNRVYFKDTCTITGHTPTISESGNTGTVIKRNNHISIDCGCVFGHNLSIYCMETDEEVYIPAEFQIEE